MILGLRTVWITPSKIVLSFKISILKQNQPINLAHLLCSMKLSYFVRNLTTTTCRSKEKRRRHFAKTKQLCFSRFSLAAKSEFLYFLHQITGQLHHLLALPVPCLLVSSPITISYLIDKYLVVRYEASGDRCGIGP